MEIIQAEYTIVTPMFIGGADQSPTDGIRPPSVKGALRFWWRALNWGKFWRENNEDEREALKALHREEARLFGAAMDDKNKSGGQGIFLLSITSRKLTTKAEDTVHRAFNTHHAARYLGYGVMKAFDSIEKGTTAGQLTRGCINENQRFTLKLAFKETVESSIQEALIALGLLGGLGSRSRHGLGSLTLETLTKKEMPQPNRTNDHSLSEEIWSKPTTKEAYNTEVNDLLRDKLISPSPAPYSCFDQGSRIDKLDQTRTPYMALDNFARAMMMYRSWGKGKKGKEGREVLGQPREERFRMDHDWSKKMSHVPRNFHPERVVFGLPHNYDNISVTSEHYERRSSPLLLHIHQLTTNSFLSVSIFLPSLFLPEGEKIKADGNNVDNQTNYTIITNFLDNPKPNNAPRFPYKQSIIQGIEA